MSVAGALRYWPVIRSTPLSAWRASARSGSGTPVLRPCWRSPSSAETCGRAAGLRLADERERPVDPKATGSSFGSRRPGAEPRRALALGSMSGELLLAVLDLLVYVGRAIG